MSQVVINPEELDKMLSLHKSMNPIINIKLREDGGIGLATNVMLIFRKVFKEHGIEIGSELSGNELTIYVPKCYDSDDPDVYQALHDAEMTVQSLPYFEEKSPLE